MKKLPPHPRQPLVVDAGGVVRFRENAIVRFLLDAGPFDMNTIAAAEFSREDREQFAQLIGYSVSGFGELPYASDAVFNDAASEGDRIFYNWKRRERAALAKRLTKAGSQ